MKVYLEINKCIECPYLRASKLTNTPEIGIAAICYCDAKKPDHYAINSGLDAVKHIMSVAIADDKTDTIPDWCPLTDASKQLEAVNAVIDAAKEVVQAASVHTEEKVTLLGMALERLGE